MGEWQGYRLDDLLMFTPEVYFRLFERYNGMLWPGHLVALSVAIWMFVVTRDSGLRQSRWIAGVLGAAWLFIAWAFFFRYYAEIFLAAPWFAVGFALQGLLLITAGTLGRLRFAWGTDAVGGVGAMLLFYAAVGHPLIGILSGREWEAIELFLLTPDPTAIGTLGLLLMISGRSTWMLALGPLLWCVISGATYWVMEADSGAGVIFAALVAFAAMVARSLVPRL
ncbi:DUF6064 family protein [Thiohalomonas denitrificans]|uniref:MFS transporter permease n=1 Tax=Thiohalomonas denitrificans TaxID=415747 RepID=A0A1G5QNQ6_9GAMM|nr:DUF6064 family protein [Thiohalomonas denitrificans]SCZ62749.1 hypothetical protein SAMN03097708_02329 [Thiohalomonas denitrificans]